MIYIVYLIKIDKVLLNVINVERFTMNGGMKKFVIFRKGDILTHR
jgi:hypothetical protein